MIVMLHQTLTHLAESLTEKHRRTWDGALVSTERISEVPVQCVCKTVERVSLLYYATTENSVRAALRTWRCLGCAARVAPDLFESYTKHVIVVIFK